MTSDLFHHFKTAANYGDSVTSSAARAQLKVWDQRHESQHDWTEELREDIASIDVWNEVTCGQSVTGVDDCGILPEEKWEYIRNPRLTTEEVWQLCADESAVERDYDYDYDDYPDCYYDDCYDDYYDDYDPYYDDYYEYHPCDYEWAESDHPSDVFYCREMEQAGDKWIEDCKVWSETVQEIARFEESCDPLQPEPRPLISAHHYRKAA